MRAQLLRRGEEMNAHKGEWGFGAMIPVKNAFKRMDDGRSDSMSLPSRVFFEVLRRLNVKVGKNSESVIIKALSLNDGSGRIGYGKLLDVAISIDPANEELDRKISAAVIAAMERGNCR